jgi:hypothetical protein
VKLVMTVISAMACCVESQVVTVMGRDVITTPFGCCVCIPWKACMTMACDVRIVGIK